MNREKKDSSPMTREEALDALWEALENSPATSLTIPARAYDTILRAYPDTTMVVFGRAVVRGEE